MFQPPGSVRCVGPLVVDGNLVVHSLNGIDIRQLIPRLVLNGTTAEITGKIGHLAFEIS